MSETNPTNGNHQQGLLDDGGLPTDIQLGGRSMDLGALKYAEVFGDKGPKAVVHRATALSGGREIGSAIVPPNLLDVSSYFLAIPLDDRPNDPFTYVPLDKLMVNMQLSGVDSIHIVQGRNIDGKKLGFDGTTLTIDDSGVSANHALVKNKDGALCVSVKSQNPSFLLEVEKPQSKEKQDTSTNRAGKVALASSFEPPNANNKVTIEQTLEQIGFIEILDKARTVLEASSDKDIKLAARLDRQVREDFNTMRSKLRRADEEGSWSGNRLSNHPVLKRQLIEFVDDTLRLLPNDKDDYASDERQEIATGRGLQVGAESLSGVASNDADIKKIKVQLNDLSHRYSSLTRKGTIDTTALRRPLVRLRQAGYDSQITVSDVMTIFTSIRIALDTCVDQGRTSGVLKRQLAEDINAFSKVT